MIVTEYVSPNILHCLERVWLLVYIHSLTFSFIHICYLFICVIVYLCYLLSVLFVYNAHLQISMEIIAAYHHSFQIH